MVYKIPTKVIRLEQKSRVTRGFVVEGEAKCFREDLGWFVHFEGSYESLFIGKDRPNDLEPGTHVEIVIRPKPRKDT
jgi:hypothetical protein